MRRIGRTTTAVNSAAISRNDSTSDMRRQTSRQCSKWSGPRTGTYQLIGVESLTDDAVYPVPLAENLLADAVRGIR